MKTIFKYFFIINSLSYSQTLNINVFDQISSIPLEGSNVIVSNEKGLEIGASTNKFGNCSFENLEKGKYVVSVGFIGYDEFSKEVIINDLKDYVLNCSLLIKSIIIPELNIISEKNTPYKKLAGAGTVINQKAIKQISPIGTQEILKHVPGIHGFADDGIGNSRISVGIRGLNPRRSSRVLVLEDGVPIQPALYVYPNMYYNPPVERIDGVQVIKGSGVVKYGPQTMGGVINYYTRRPSSSFEGFINLTAGGNGYKSLFTEINGFGTYNLKNAIQFLYKSGNGFRDNNDFEQLNTTMKMNYNFSENKNLYSKFSVNYENSQATYTGLTEYSFENNPTFNPKEDDNFKVFRTSLDLIETEKINQDLIKTRKLFGSFFDRRWWRETDIFVSESNPNVELSHETIEDSFLDDIIRIGNGESNFGILRTFYVLGYEQSYKFNYNKFLSSEFGMRAYWERFIDNKVIGDHPAAREGIYYYEADTYTDSNLNYVYDDGEEFVDINGDGEYNDSEEVIGQSHHYETTALSGFISNNFEFEYYSINSGIRFEIFEQERIDLLNGASYLDKTSFVLLPSIGFITNYELFNFFGGIHRGYTSPSSGALKVSNFAIDSGLDLEAEKSWNKEIGIRATELFSILNLEFSAFHVDIENLVAAGRGTAFKNLGKVETMGTEIASQITFNRYLPKLHFTQTFLKTSIKSGLLDKYSFMGSGDAIDISGNKLPYAPENSILVGFEYDFLDKMNLRVDFNYVGKVFTDFHNIGNNNLRGSWDNIGNIGIKGPVPSYSFINANFSYNLTDNTDLNIVAKNLTDEIYIGSRLHSNPNQTRADLSSGIIPGPRRQINFSIKYSL